MVTEAYAETQEDLDDIDGFSADAENDADAQTPDSQPQDDPLSAMAERVAQMESAINELRALDPTQVKRELGQVRSLQSEIAKLQARNPVAEVDPRLASHEDVIVRLANAMVRSVATDDDDRKEIQGILSKLDTARTERDRERLRKELLEELAPKDATPQEQPKQEQTPEEVAATSRVLGYAEAKGVDAATIPAAVWQLRPGETLEQAVVRVKAHIDETASGGAPKRAAARTQAAGTAPTRTAAAQGDYERYLAYGAGEIDMSDKELADLERRLKAQGKI